MNALCIFRVFIRLPCQFLCKRETPSRNDLFPQKNREGAHPCAPKCTLPFRPDVFSRRKTRKFAEIARRDIKAVFLAMLARLGLPSNQGVARPSSALNGTANSSPVRGAGIQPWVERKRNPR